MTEKPNRDEQIEPRPNEQSPPVPDIEPDPNLEEYIEKDLNSRRKK